MEGELLAEYSGDRLVHNRTLNMWLTHNGIDIVAPEGTEVKAALTGKVEESFVDDTMGRVVILSHSDGIKTLYAGLKEVSVEKGGKVSAGKTIGTVGTPPFEAREGAHLHFEYMKDGTYLDPAENLKAGKQNK